MKQPFLENGLQHQRYQRVHCFGHRFWVLFGVVINPFTGRKLQCEHGAARTFRHDIRNPQAREICHRDAKQHDGTRFAGEIGFPVQADGKFTHNTMEVERA